MDTPLPLIEPLSEREAGVLACLAEGLSNSEIADRLFLAPSTVKWYVRQLNSKFDTANREDIVSRARQLGLLDTPTAHMAKTNLPYQTTPFVGRDAELEELYALLTKPDVRLLTILAPGGMGKTRIALEAAQQQQLHFPDGVFFVSLQPLSDIPQIMPAIAASLGYQFLDDGRNPATQLRDYLTPKRLLLLIDNWEHLLDGAPLVNTLLNAARAVKVLATSREKLNLSSETVYSLRGMLFPTWDTPEDAGYPTDSLNYDAAKLLVQAAQRVKPDWAVTADNLPHVARVCKLTAGMPLGILLAVSWLDVLSLEEIAAEIQKSADFLETQQRDVPERQRSIRAVFEYTWQRLPPDERQVFMKLAVFRGGCTRAAAETITGTSLRSLQTLVNKSLLVRGNDGRYDFHELLRQYAEAELDASGQAEATRAAHADFFAAFMAQREPALKGGGQIAARDEINADLENVLAGWKWALAHHRFKTLEGYIESLAVFWWLKNAVEGRKLFHDARATLAAYNHETVYGWLVAHESHFTETDDPELELVEALERSLQRAHDRGDQRLAAFSLRALSKLYDMNGDFQRAWDLIVESRELYEALGDQYGLAMAIFFMGYVADQQGKPEAAYQLTCESLELARQTGNLYRQANALSNISTYLKAMNRLEEAEARFRESMTIHRQLGTQGAMIYPMLGLSDVLYRRGKQWEAHQLAEEALFIAREVTSSYLSVCALSTLWLFHLLHENYKAVADLSAQFVPLMEASDHTPSKIWAMMSIGVGAIFSEDIDTAERYLIKTLTLATQRLSSDVVEDLHQAIFWFSFIFLQRGELERAAEYLACAYNLVPLPWWFDALPAVRRLRAQLATSLGTDAFEAAWARGKALDVQNVAQELLAEFGGK